MIGTDTFGFDLNLKTTQKENEILFVGATGENTDDLSVTLSDDTFESISELRKGGYYLRFIGVICYTTNNFIQIDSLIFQINGERYELVLDTPVCHYVMSSNDGSSSESVTDLIMLNSPSIISTQSIKKSGKTEWDKKTETEYSYLMLANNDLLLTGIEYSDFIVMNDPVVYVNDKYSGVLNNESEIQVSKGDKIKITGYLSVLSENVFPFYKNIYCTCHVAYKTGITSDISYVDAQLVSQGISGFDEAKDFLSKK